MNNNPQELKAFPYFQCKMGKKIDVKINPMDMFVSPTYLQREAGGC